MSSLQNQAKTKQAASGIAYPICCFPCATPSYSFLITAMSQNTQNKASTGGAPPAATANAPTLSESGNAEPTEQQKTPKPSAAEVTNKVLAIIMVSEPLTLADMCKQLQELPRDSIQAVLEVLQVLGLVVQLSTTKEVAGTKPNSSNNMTYVYALTEFAKFSTAFPITQAESEIKSMQAKTRDVRSRIEELQALSTLDEDTMSPEARAVALKELTQGFLQRNPLLREDPLYQAISAEQYSTVHAVQPFVGAVNSTM